MTGGLSDHQWNLLRAALRESPRLERVVLYGSRATETHRHSSDVDLALVGPDLTLDDELRILAAIDDSDFPYRVDLVRLAAVRNPALIRHIETEGRVVLPAGA